MTREIVETSICSSHAPMQQQRRQRNVLMRLFDTPSVGLKSIDEGVDFDQHDMSKHDETEPRTPHDSEDEPPVDDHETFPRAAQVKSTISLDITFLVDESCVPIKIQKIAGIY